jgi:hypothetical protein
MLSDEVDLLPALLLPLAGPEQFEGEEDKMEQLPEDLQYLPDTKTREPDPDIRKMLIETLMKVRACVVCVREGEGGREGGGGRESDHVWYSHALLSQLALERCLRNAPAMRTIKHR